VDGSGGEYCLMLSDGSGTPGAGNYPAADNATIQNIIFTGTVQEFLVGTGWPYPGGANNVTITGCTFTGQSNWRRYSWLRDNSCCTVFRFYIYRKHHFKQYRRVGSAPMDGGQGHYNRKYILDRKLYLFCVGT